MEEELVDLARRAVDQDKLAPADEDTPVTLEDMVGHYKRSKFLAERVVEQWAAKGLPVVIVNPSAPIGDGDLKPTATGKMILDFLNRKVPAYVDTGLNLIDVGFEGSAARLLASKTLSSWSPSPAGAVRLEPGLMIRVSASAASRIAWARG